jgi:hypothetical protein
LQYDSVHAVIGIKTLAIVSSVPYVLLLWITVYLIFTWAAIYSGAGEKKSGDPFAKFKRPVIVGNSLVSAVLVAMFVMASVTEDAQQKEKITQAGSLLFASVSCVIAIAFQAYGTLLVRLLTKDFASKSASAIFKLACLFCLSFMGQSVIWAVSTLNSDLFFAKFDIINSVFFSLDLVGHFCVIRMFWKTFNMIREKANEAAAALAGGSKMTGGQRTAAQKLMMRSKTALASGKSQTDFADNELAFTLQQGLSATTAGDGEALDTKGNVLPDDTTDGNLIDGGHDGNDADFDLISIKIDAMTSLRDGLNAVSQPQSVAGFSPPPKRALPSLNIADSDFAEEIMPLPPPRRLPALSLAPSASTPPIALQPLAGPPPRDQKDKAGWPRAPPKRPDAAKPQRPASRRPPPKAPPKKVVADPPPVIGPPPPRPRPTFHKPNAPLSPSTELSLPPAIPPNQNLLPPPPPRLRPGGAASTTASPSLSAAAAVKGGVLLDMELRNAFRSQ